MSDSEQSNLKRKSRSLAAKSSTGVDEPHSPMQLNFWPDDVRGLSNAVLRGALFSISKKRRMAKKRTELATIDGYKIFFKGERFNMSDLDLWANLLHISRTHQLGNHVEFLASDLLKALDRDRGGRAYEDLKEDISRLMSGVVEITLTNANETFIGSLIHNVYRQEDSQRYVVVFDPKMRKLFDTGYTHIDWVQRKKLKGDSLAQYLHGFYATHASPLRYKVSTIKELCGSTAGRLTDFRVALRKALDRLQAVGAIQEWSIDPESDLVTVKRRGSMSQQRFIAKKAKVKASAEFVTSKNISLDGF